MSRITGLTRLGLVVLLAATPVAGAAVLPVPAAQAQGDSAVEQSKEITNYGKGTTRQATVRVSRTTNLVDRQQVAIDLAGFTPSYNANYTVAKGSRVEYPVVVMQCRGDTPTRNTCINEERGQWHGGFDANAPAEQRVVAEKQAQAGDSDVYPGADFLARTANMMRAEQLPFRAANGVSYLWSVRSRPDGSPYVNDPTLKSFPPTDVTSEGAATISTRNVPIGTEGTNEFLFEVRQKASQPSLGCTSARKCSIVVVPVMDMACVDPLPAKGADCAAGPKGPEPGSNQGGTDNYNRFLASQQWLAESNWRNRFVIPLTFAPDLETCDLRGGRPVIQTYGSELVNVAQERWAAAYCTGARPGANYLPGYIPGSEYFARRRLTTQLGASYQENAVFVTQPVTESQRPVAHAPAALTGFAVAFVVDDGNGRQAQNLTLSARLLAKLLTQSYNPLVVPPERRTGKRPYDGNQPVRSEADANKYYVAHLGLVNNPRSLFADPEFEDLNPDFVLNDPTGAFAFHLANTLNPTVFTVESDIMMDVTRYVTSDPAARAWLDGQPDPYGMRVNPAWQGLQPTQLYSQLDTWVRTPKPRMPGWVESPPTVESTRYEVYGGGDTCDEMHQTPYLTKVGNIANSAKLSAQTLLDRRGSATPTCSASTTPIPKPEQAPAPEFPGDLVDQDVIFSETKEEPRDFGKRAQLALTTVAQARLYELPTAKLVNAGGKAVAPTAGTMLGALHAAVVDETAGTIQIDHKAITGAGWYPGTMVAYLAVPTSGVERQLAGQYADYIEFMATTGQVPGQTLANLPPGYDLLPPTLVEQAKTAARMVREQRGEVPPPPEDPLGDGPASVTDVDSSANNPGSGLPVSAQSADENEKVDGDPANVAKTEGASSWLARWTLPLLLGFGVLAALVAFGIQVGSQPGHPLRRRLDWLLRAVGRR